MKREPRHVENHGSTRLLLSSSPRVLAVPLFVLHANLEAHCLAILGGTVIALHNFRVRPVLAALPSRSLVIRLLYSSVEADESLVCLSLFDRNSTFAEETAQKLRIARGVLVTLCRFATSDSRLLPLPCLFLRCIPLVAIESRDSSPLSKVSLSLSLSRRAAFELVPTGTEKKSRTRRNGEVARRLA